MKMIDVIGEPAMYEQLAEECVELAHIALKAARRLRQENPTPMTWQEIRMRLDEEASDVCLCLDELRIKPIKEIQEQKVERFKQRWGGRK